MANRGGGTEGRTDGCLEITPYVLQDIGSLGPLPKKEERKKRRKKKEKNGGKGRKVKERKKGKKERENRVFIIIFFRNYSNHKYV